ncbi:hypothetical protein ACFV1B_06360 [Streptomyces sp. NPDC059637]|uniref:hypothetical protein n=1 Tax=Streptomyces sp. NPDC059637 TaxID=3347752 RepID=UPI0036843BAA
MTVITTGAQAARTRALAVLRIRGAALAVALLPAAAAVLLFAGGADGTAWNAVRWTVAAVALLALLAAGATAAVLARARPARSPVVEVLPSEAPEFHRMVRDLADRLGVPAPSTIALTPDCDSWLEDRPDGNGRPRRPRRGAALPSRLRTAAPPAGPRGGADRPGTRPTGRGTGADAPALVIGSPFLWWMRVAELRALLAPVVAGTAASADPDIAAARRFLRGLDAAVATADQGLRQEPGPGAGARLASLLRRPALGLLGTVSRLLLRSCREHAAEMERAVAAAASERAQSVDYGLRIVAQEQVGLAYAGWDRLLTRVALPAWRMGRWPARLDAGVVAALTELSRRDRLAEGFESRLGERPACDMLEEPGTVDAAVSLLAARLFHGGPAAPGPHWSPVEWDAYPEEVVDRIWRTDAARLHRVLDECTPVLRAEDTGATLARVLDRLSSGGSEELAARLAEHAAREEAEAHRPAPGPVPGPDELPVRTGQPDAFVPVLQLVPPRTGRDLLADHVTAMVCCAAVDTAGAVPGLDWLDGPALLVAGVRRGDLAWPVARLVENGDAAPLRAWLNAVGVRMEKPVRLA